MIVGPDPFAPPMAEDLLLPQDLMLSQPFDVWVAPELDSRYAPGDPVAVDDDLGVGYPAPPQDRRRSVREETRFIKPREVVAGNAVFELVRLAFTRSGYLTRVATFLEVVNLAGEVQYISNDIADPFPTFIADLGVRWHLLQDEQHLFDFPPPFLTAAPSLHVPTAHRVDALPAMWDDMRYHWGQRPANKIARVPYPCLLRLFVEFTGTVSLFRFRVGGQLGGYEGEK